jgi:flagellar hook-length control protein FliK
VVQLRQSLAQIGVNLSEFSVDIQHDGNRSRNQSFNNHRLKKSARTGAAEDESKDERIETFRVDLRKGLLHWIA